MYQTLEEAEKLLGPGMPRLEGLLGAFEKNPDNGWYGYGKRYFTSFDPYEMKSPSVPNVSAEFVINMKNALTVSRRVMDVALHIGTALDNAPLFRQVGQLATALSKVSDLCTKLDSVFTQFEAYPASNPDGVRHRGESRDELENNASLSEFVDSIEAAEGSSQRRATLRLSPPPLSSSPTVAEPTTARAWVLPPGRISGSIRTETSPIEADPEGTVAIEETAPRLLTADDLATLLGGPGVGQISVSAPDGIVTIESTRQSADGRYTSYLSLGGELFDLLAGGPLTDAVPRTDLANASQDIGTASTVMQEFVGLFSGLTNPDRAYVKVCRDLVGCFSDTVKALDALGGIAGDAFTAPSPPSMIGLFARDGITLGTTDRVVSAAGKGYLFFADGGTGSRDHHKFSSDVERPIGEATDGAAGGLGDLCTEQDTDIGAEIPGTNGFTVLSNSSASILTRSSLDLFALGTEPRGDDNITGRGVARLGATRSVEVAAHRQVVIAATGGSQNDGQVARVQREPVSDDLCLPPVSGSDHVQVDGREDEPTGGEVSILGETIRLGSVLGSHVVQPVSTSVAWPSDESALTDRLHQFAFERSVGAPTEQVEVQAKSRVDLLSHPYSLRVARDGILLSGQLAKRDEGARDVPSRQDARARSDSQTQRKRSEARAGAQSLLAYATRMHEIAVDAHRRLNTPEMWHRTYAGLGFKEWSKLKSYYQDLKGQATEEIRPDELPPGGDDSFPVLQMSEGSIKLGFVVDETWTSYLESKPDTIAMKYSQVPTAGLTVTQGRVTQTGEWCGTGVVCDPS